VVDRFAQIRLAMLDEMQHPLDLLLQLGDELWPSYGGVRAEVVADAEYRAGRGASRRSRVALDGRDARNTCCARRRRGHAVAPLVSRNGDRHAQEGGVDRRAIVATALVVLR
jgi:hypothetical protein